MKESDGILILLQDIKEILYGISLLIIGGICCLIGILINNGFGILLLFIGIFVLLVGIIYIRHGHSYHEVVENQDE